MVVKDLVGIDYLRSLIRALTPYSWAQFGLGKDKEFFEKAYTYIEEHY
jgi:hypothetical protein